jgi:hypothetical protein
MAIAHPLRQDYNSAPVFMGIDIETKLPTQVKYGVSSGVGDDKPTQFVKSRSFNDYMNVGPMDEKLGLWAVVLDGAFMLGLKPKIFNLRAKYAKTAWVVR